MFIWDFVAGEVLDQIVDWIYGQAMGFLGNFFAEMGNMGVELFQMSWVQSIVLFFSYLAWALYGTGLVVSASTLTSTVTLPLLRSHTSVGLYLPRSVSVP